MKKSLIVVVAILSVFAALGTIVVAEGKAESASLSEEDSATQDFEFVEPEAGSVQGSLETSEIVPIAFDSDVAVSDGDKSVVTSVETEDFSLKADRDLEEQTVTAGAGGEEITAEQKEALTALCQELELLLGPLGTPLVQEEDLLLRVTCYYAEVPVGYPLENFTLSGPSAVYIQDAPSQQPMEQEDTVFVDASYRRDLSGYVSDAPTAEECERARTLKDENRLEDFTTYVACQQNGDDGVSELNSCKPYGLNFYWDSTRNPRLCYGFRGKRNAGPCTDYCKGRCGKGCGNSRQGFYTRDCAEHDDCVGQAGGKGSLYNDENCGDEVEDADDDFFRRYRRTCNNCNS